MIARQLLTQGPAAHYPLYYFVPSHSADGRYLIVHQEAEGEVQLVRLELASGATVQLSAGRSRRSGWAIWCREDVDGIYDHLSCLNPGRDEVYWFEDGDGQPGACEVWAAAIASAERRRLATLPGRIPVGQSACSPDGRWLALLHADHDHWRSGLAGRTRVEADHQAWRERTPVEVGLIDTRSGAYRRVIALDFHVHHVLFVDDQHLLLNHLPDGNGAWIIACSGEPESIRIPRPPNAQGRICHQQVTANGIHFEAFAHWTGSHATWAGHCQWPSLACSETLLPLPGYTHTARDPQGRRHIFEVANPDQHLLYELLPQGSPAPYRILHELPPYPDLGQRFHAHPFIGPCACSLYFTEVVEGRSQVGRLDLGSRSTPHTQHHHPRTLELP